MSFEYDQEFEELLRQYVFQVQKLIRFIWRRHSINGTTRLLYAHIDNMYIGINCLLNGFEMSQEQRTNLNIETKIINSRSNHLNFIGQFQESKDQDSIEENIDLLSNNEIVEMEKNWVSLTNSLLLVEGTFRLDHH